MPSRGFEPRPAGKRLPPFLSHSPPVGRFVSVMLLSLVLLRGADEDIQRAEAIGAGFIHFHHTASRIASAYALLGQPAPAVQWLRRAADDGMPCYPCFATDPDLDAIRHDPGFIAFMQDLASRWEGLRATL